MQRAKAACNADLFTGLITGFQQIVWKETKPRMVLWCITSWPQYRLRRGWGEMLRYLFPTCRDAGGTPMEQLAFLDRSISIDMLR
jgi:hypothetical protein